jgi:hypothetical protein
MADERSFVDSVADAPPTEGEPAATPVDDGDFPLSGPSRVLLATLSFAAGGIHLWMVPSHADAWLLEGLAFAAAGALQVALALVLLVRPSSVALRVSCLANAGFIAAWVVTRASGMPFGPDSGLRETAGFVDLTAVALEAALVIVGYELLVRPVRGAGLTPTVRALLSVIPIGILAVSLAAVLSPSATDHGHHGDDEGEMAAGHSDGHADGHADDHGSAPEEAADDKGLSLVMNGQGEGGGHTHDVAEVKLDEATQKELDAQLAHTKPLIDNFPTVRDAEAAGYTRSGPFGPGVGAHYRKKGGGVPNPDGWMDPEDIADGMLIYDGVEPDSKLAGFMFLSFGSDKAPEGFAGPNDQWHFHTNVCIVVRPDGTIDSPLGADTTATKDLCDKYGGAIIPNTGYMVHLWTVPGYESPQGLFSNANAKLTCEDGTYHHVPMEEIGLRTSTCIDA